jgi:hypothetical protein
MVPVTGGLYNSGNHHSLVVTSSGSLYGFYQKGAYLIGVVKSGNSGSTWTELPDLTSLTVFGVSNYDFQSFKAAIDSAGYIHCIAYDYYADATRVMSYSRLNTANDTWDSWTEPINITTVASYKSADISVDANDKPHIAYTKSSQSVWYTNKISGSWAAEDQVGGTNMRYPHILCNHDRVLVAYAYTYQYDRLYNPTTDQWQTEVQYATGTTSTQARPLAASAADSSGSGYTYHGASPNLYENGVLISGISASYWSITIVGDTRYLFFVDSTTNNLCLTINDGSGWSTPVILQGGWVNVVTAVSSYYHQNQESRLNYMYVQGKGLLYDYVLLTDVKTKKSAYIRGTSSGSAFKQAYVKGGTGVITSKSAFINGAFAALIPDGDVSKTGVWINELVQTTNLYQSIDEFPLPNDVDLILDGPAVNGDYYECSLTDPIGPIPSGIMAIKWRGRNATSGSVVARVQLRQGSTVIATREQTLPSTPTTYVHELTTGEKAAITDPTDLRLRFIVVR